ncbi:hypothetical protein GCM10027160_04350 [Streptomyces calidiresistens]|uniref:Uncharacterized protein n=1 Tax=Streptomyces calidiresistens TaxID=1485586 RepID=A0A7W3XX57_9ACTN|nr:hypothetical protein [Streptomyces calidiresistens]MBB0230451.1 hypothetical protein [Streptomyces calidiresistens]
MRNDITTEGFEDFSRRVELSQILTESCSARRISAENSVEVEMRMEMGMAPASDTVFYRLAVEADLKAGNGDVAGSVEVVILAKYDVTEGRIPGIEVLQEFADREAGPVALPYAREGVQSLASRIGFHGVLIPFVGPSLNLEDIASR